VFIIEREEVGKALTMKVGCPRSSVLKGRSTDPWGVPEVKVIFITLIRCYFTFLLSSITTVQWNTFIRSFNYSTNAPFVISMCNIIKSCMSKIVTKVQCRPMDFNVTEYEKFIDIISNCILQLIFKTLSLVEFVL
jgi:hypothetical protein